VIFHIPHASTSIPPDVRTGIVLSDEQLAEETMKITDRHTDDLFGSHAQRDDIVLVYPVSRLVVDPERFADDAQEPMTAVGMGVVYTRTSGGIELRQEPSLQERGQLLDTFYHPHHRRFAAAVDMELSRRERAIILDCHSFPARPLPYERDQNPDRPDICIGTDAYHTPAWLTRGVEKCCRAEGVSYDLNRPFAGAIVPLGYYCKNSNVCSIMVEVNRRLYMDEARGTKSESYGACRLLVGRLVTAARAAVDAKRG
jgi:N-formylglutamate deformylase